MLGIVTVITYNHHNPSTHFVDNQTEVPRQEAFAQAPTALFWTWAVSSFPSDLRVHALDNYAVVRPCSLLCPCPRPLSMWQKSIMQLKVRIT